jgi:hypothetical protein
MAAQLRRAGIAALVIFVAFAIHLANILYFEPRMGFERMEDYASMSKVAAALASQSWRWSGYGHLLTGIALFVLAAVSGRWLELQRPTAAALARMFGAAAGLGFVLTGVIDLLGRDVFTMLDSTNPGYTTALLGSLVLLRNMANATSLILLGAFVLVFTWSARQHGGWPVLFGLFSYLTAVATLLLFTWKTGYGLSYFLLPLWALGAGYLLMTRSQALARVEER